MTAGEVNVLLKQSTFIGDPLQTRKQTTSWWNQIWLVLNVLDISRQSFPDVMWCSEIKEIKKTFQTSVFPVQFLWGGVIIMH